MLPTHVTVRFVFVTTQERACTVVPIEIRAMGLGKDQTRNYSSEMFLLKNDSPATMRFMTGP